jgi:ABC-type ATPase involved in cell division/GNAT superfamily N-acetyltransferase
VPSDVPVTGANSTIELDVEHDVDVVRSARMMQMSSMFDVEITKKLSQRWHVRMPLGERDWNIGLIVGPSGAGKSSVARAAFGDALVTEHDWSSDRSLLDDFPAGMPTREVVGLLSAVGFNSPPSWMRPFRTLSTGEQFRVSCARALAETDGLVAIDEFTSVVDRQVAQVASSTVAKTVRRNGRQLVAMSCHYDIIDWLQPDWLYQPIDNAFTWRSVQPRPSVALNIARVHRAAWKLFSPHHYLSGDLMSGCECYGAWVDDRIVAFSAIRHFPHHTARNIKMGHRLVVLPDWQGLGIGIAFDDWLGQHLYERGFRYRNTISHPAMIRGYARSARWRDVSPRSAKAREHALRSMKTAKPGLAAAQADLRRLGTRSFEYAPPRASVS